MNVFKTNLVAVNPANESLATPSLEIVVESASELTWLPADTLKQINVEPRRDRAFTTLEGRFLTRPVGYAILKCGNFQTVDEVVFALPGDGVMLGQRTLEGFGVWVDNVHQQFVEQMALVPKVDFHSGVAPKPAAS